MSIFTDIADDLQEIINSDIFTDATITSKGGKAAVASFNPVTGAPVAGGTGGTVTACRAVASTVKSRANDGTIITMTELIFNVPANIGDKLTLGGKTYVLGDVSSEAPNGVALIYMAKASK